MVVPLDRKSTRLNSSHTEIYTLSLHDALPIYKTALVTGTSRGIGRTTASALAEAGAHVLVYYGRSVQDAESLVADIRSNEGRADAIRADLGTPEGATLLAKEVSSIVGE